LGGKKWTGKVEAARGTVKGERIVHVLYFDTQRVIKDDRGTKDETETVDSYIPDSQEKAGDKLVA
jgi:hypothetical protein